MGFSCYSNSFFSWCVNSPSVKLLSIIVLLVCVSGFFWVSSPNAPHWVSLSFYMSFSFSNVKEYGKTEHSVLVNHSSPSSPPPAVLSTVDGVAASAQPVSDSPSALVVVDQQRVATRLDHLEAVLQRSRTAIKSSTINKQIYDPDYTPTGPMYHNANAFQRSYMEMEKQFKVFVYEDGEPPLIHNGPCRSIYSSEGNFIHQIEQSSFRTLNPDKAHVFFLPFSVAMLVRFVYVKDSYDYGLLRKFVRDYIKIISTNSPFWNRSLAADHFMLSCHDWGPAVSLAVPQLHHNAIRVLCNANTSEGFRPGKDVSFPEINLRTGEIKGFLGGLPPSRRHILAFFAGGLHGPIRPVLLKHWKNKDEDIKVYESLPRGINYYAMLRKSKYCICPSGYEVASPRVVEAIYTGCVPVLISKNYVVPFSDVLNWKAFSVEVSSEDIPNLKNILNAIPARQYIKMQRRVLQIRRHFEVHNPPKRYDVFHMVLHSVWLRRLNIHVKHQ